MGSRHLNNDIVKPIKKIVLPALRILPYIGNYSIYFGCYFGIFL